jgi:hypothetical protein
VTYLTPFILFVLGVVLWRLQLVAKRKFEVAEQALTAFSKAADGLSILRNPMIWGTESASVEVPEDISAEDQKRVRTYNVYAARSQSIGGAFAELRTAQILVDLHLGAAVAKPMEVLITARGQVAGAVAALYAGPRFDPEGADPKLVIDHRNFEVSMRRRTAEHRGKDGKPDDTDEMSQQVDAARAELEAACRPFLDHPPWLKALSSYLQRWRLA